jgi:hypothetical protein
LPILFGRPQGVHNCCNKRCNVCSPHVPPHPMRLPEPHGSK